MKERSKTGKVLNIISNVFFCLVMVLLIVFMVYGFGNLSQNKVPSFFGQSYVRIMSGSMEEPAYKNGEQISDGFTRGDIAVLERKNVSEIEVGDIIAFYYCSLIQSDFNGSDTINDFKTGTNLPEELDTANTQIIFHQVNDIQVDSQGNIWLRTKGTSNGASDKYTRADYVVGVYTDGGLAGFLEFISSSTGIIVLVVIPSCVVLLMLLLNIIQIVDKMIKDKKEEEARRQALLQASMAGGEQQQADTQANTIGLSDASMKVFQAQLAEMDKAEATQTDTKTPPQKPNVQKPPVKPTIQKAETNAQADAKPAETTQTPDAKQAGAITQTKTPPQKPVINKPAEAKPTAATKPAETTAKPAEKTEAKSAENKPAEVKKTDTKTKTAKTEAKAETKSSTAKVETKPAEAKPADTKATTAKPAKEATTKKAEEKPTTAKAETKATPAKTEAKTTAKAEVKSATKSTTAKKAEPKAKAETKPATKSTTTKKAEPTAKTETKPATKTTAKKTDTDKK